MIDEEKIKMYESELFRMSGIFFIQGILCAISMFGLCLTLLKNITYWYIFIIPIFIIFLILQNLEKIILKNENANN